MENSCIINVKNEHNHESDERKAERQQLRCNAKRKASEDATARPSKIIRKQLQTMSETNLHQDDIKNVSKAIYRERRKRHPTLPKSRNDVVFLPVLTVSEVCNMGYSAPWTLLNKFFSSPGW